MSAIYIITFVGVEDTDRAPILLKLLEIRLDRRRNVLSHSLENLTLEQSECQVIKSMTAAWGWQDDRRCVPAAPSQFIAGLSARTDSSAYESVSPTAETSYSHAALAVHV